MSRKGWDPVNQVPGTVPLLIPPSECLKMPENKVTKLFPGKSDQWCHEHLWAASRHQGLQASCSQTPNGVQIRSLESNCQDLQNVIAAQNVQVTHSSGKIPNSVQTLGLYQTSWRWWEARTGWLSGSPSMSLRASMIHSRALINVVHCNEALVSDGLPTVSQNKKTPWVYYSPTYP